MGRVRFLGSHPFDRLGPIFADTSPKYAFLPTWGDQQMLTAPALEYPCIVNGDDCAKTIGVIRRYRMDFSYEVHDDDTNSDSSGTGTFYWISTAVDEEALFTQQNTGEMALMAADGGEWAMTFTPEVGDPADSDGTFDTPPSGGTVRTLPDITDELGSGIPFIYDPSSEMFAPRIIFDAIMVGGAVTNITNQALDTTVHTAAIAQSATFLGQACPVYVQINGTSLTSFSMSIVADGYWTYTGASGDIWDASSGTELQPHGTEED